MTAGHSDLAPDALRDRAEGLLKARLGAEVRLKAPDRIEPRYRSAVFTCPVVSGPDRLGSSVFIKQAITAPDDGSRLEDPAEAQGRFAAEVRALSFVQSLLPDGPPTPFLYAWDGATRTLVMEDLGQGRSLADLLQAEDRTAALSGLHAYARSMGRLHAATMGRRAEFGALLPELGPPAGATLAENRRTKERHRAFLEACIAVGIPVPHGFTSEMGAVRARLDASSAMFVLNVSDICPDNHFIQGESVRFFDLEFAGFGHPLMDASYLALPFPTCWCMGRLPSDVEASALDAYRSEIFAIPELARPETFGRALLDACAFWTVHSLGAMLGDSLKKDQEWGLATVRQRNVFRLEELARRSAAANQLPETESLCRTLAQTLRARWVDQDLEMPDYPAFAGSQSPAEAKP